MSLKKINFGDKEVDKKKFYSSKEAILLDSVDLNKRRKVDVDVKLMIQRINFFADI